MNKRKIPILSIVLYITAGVLTLYMFWAVSHTIGYISEMVKQGQLVVDGNEYDIANFYMTNCVQYALLAMILFALGWILQKVSSPKSGNMLNEEKSDADQEVSNHGEVSHNTVDEDDFADWFQSKEAD